MFDKVKAAIPAPAMHLVGWIVTALILLFFWHPVWQFLGSICDKADALFK